MLSITISALAFATAVSSADATYGSPDYVAPYSGYDPKGAICNAYLPCGDYKDCVDSYGKKASKGTCQSSVYKADGSYGAYKDTTHYSGYDSYAQKCDEYNAKCGTGYQCSDSYGKYAKSGTCQKVVYKGVDSYGAYEEPTHYSGYDSYAQKCDEYNAKCGTGYQCSDSYGKYAKSGTCQKVVYKGVDSYGSYEEPTLYTGYDAKADHCDEYNAKCRSGYQCSDSYGKYAKSGTCQKVVYKGSNSYGEYVDPSYQAPDYDPKYDPVYREPHTVWVTKTVTHCPYSTHGPDYKSDDHYDGYDSYAQKCDEYSAKCGKGYQCSDSYGKYAKSGTCQKVVYKGEDHYGAYVDDYKSDKHYDGYDSYAQKCDEYSAKCRKGYQCSDSYGKYAKSGTCQKVIYKGADSYGEYVEADASYQTPLYSGYDSYAPKCDEYSAKCGRGFQCSDKRGEKARSGTCQKIVCDGHGRYGPYRDPSYKDPSYKVTYGQTGYVSDLKIARYAAPVYDPVRRGQFCPWRSPSPTLRQCCALKDAQTTAQTEGEYDRQCYLLYSAALLPDGTLPVGW